MTLVYLYLGDWFLMSSVNDVVKDVVNRLEVFYDSFEVSEWDLWYLMYVNEGSAPHAVARTANLIRFF